MFLPFLIRFLVGSPGRLGPPPFPLHIRVRDYSFCSFVVRPICLSASHSVRIFLRDYQVSCCGTCSGRVCFVRSVFLWRNRSERMCRANVQSECAKGNYIGKGILRSASSGRKNLTPIIKSTYGMKQVLLKHDRRYSMNCRVVDGGGSTPLNGPNHSDQRSRTNGFSPTVPHQRSRTNGPSPTAPRQRSLTNGPSPTVPHQRSLTNGPSPTVTHRTSPTNSPDADQRPTKLWPSPLRRRPRTTP